MHSGESFKPKLLRAHHNHTIDLRARKAASRKFCMGAKETPAFRGPFCKCFWNTTLFDRIRQYASLGARGCEATKLPSGQVPTHDVRQIRELIDGIYLQEFIDGT